MRNFGEREREREREGEWILVEDRRTSTMRCHGLV
jgi:hypothetical protein